ncbi:hypothetical protein D1B31_12740 [Neobacillus notoginsengisoli]|uniref:Regulatory protein YycH domain-containing protein n=1 Tax=Neobacillus notoginsengisoli TaxID=1578198 RepID=A0A417YTM1_9BACI|nr:two-component system activity regulator YycH [Neobacillus notoginsengisoli]RHW40407.1 hypothetical protein D1B31_12740 [Neobacillus notoginsengisoli]
MKYETIKSVVLTILVTLSMWLTWALWTYQPNYDPLQSGPLIEEVKIGEKKEEARIIKPDRIIYHIDDNHYGSSKVGDIDKLMKEMASWEFLDVKNYTEQAGTFKQSVHGDGKVEIVFPHEVPIEVFRNIIQFEQKKIPSFRFDRLVIDMKTLQKDRGAVYFANVRNQEIYVSYISQSFLSQFNRSFFAKANQHPPYFAFDATGKRTIFLPAEETEMLEYTYLPMDIDSELFKEALFKNPSFVQKSIVGNGVEYANDTSKLNIYTDENRLVFVNPSEETDYLSGSTNLLKRSIDFINEHGGWTDPYRYAFLDESKQRVTFRLYSMDGYPVFNEWGLSEITEIWGRNEITRFTRPTFAMELAYEYKMVTRPSGREALEFLQSNGNFRPELLENLVLGYRLERDQQSNRLITLKPAWFYLYNKRWMEISSEELGGLKRGLE